jgi:hypothetical protein
MKTTSRRITYAVLFASLAGLAVAVGVWCLAPRAKSAAIVRLQVRNRIPAIQKQQIALAKSRLVLTDAVQRLDPALLARVYSPVGDQEPVEWLEKLLKIEFVGPELMSMTLTGDARDDADLLAIIEAVANAFRTNLLETDAKAEVKLLGDPTSAQGNDRKRRLIGTAIAGVGTVALALVAMLAWRPWRSRGPTLGPLGA